MPPSYRRPPRFAVGCALAAFAAVLASPAWADPAPSFAELLAQLGQTPATLEAGALSDAAEARVRQARARPNPTIALDAENAFGTGPFSGYANAETTLSISQDLELWGRRTAGGWTWSARIFLWGRTLGVWEPPGTLPLAPTRPALLSSPNM